VEVYRYLCKDSLRQKLRASEKFDAKICCTLYLRPKSLKEQAVNRLTPCNTVQYMHQTYSQRLVASRQENVYTEQQP
jgi:hypothetical protein